jgi:hypothetical protein
LISLARIHRSITKNLNEEFQDKSKKTNRKKGLSKEAGGKKNFGEETSSEKACGEEDQGKNPPRPEIGRKKANSKEAGSTGAL